MEELEKLKLLIEAELGPYKKQMAEIVKETNKMQSDVDRATTKVKNSFSKMGNFIKKVVVGLGLIKFGNMSLNLASDLRETESVVELAFGNMRKMVDDFAEHSIHTHGMSGLTAKQTAGDFMLMSKGMGMAEDVAASMSLEVTKLSADIASLKNTSQEMAQTALAGIWTGVTEPLKKYGVVMTQANLQEYAYTQGIQKKLSAMSQQELVMLRYAYVMNSLNMAQGNFKRESMGWAAQTKILSEQWKELLIIIGNGLSVVLLPVLQLINKIMGYLIALAKAVSNVFSRLFGIKSAAGSASTSIAPLSNAVGGIGNALGGLGSDGAKNLDKVGKAAEDAGKKANGALASFDDLNVLAQNIDTPSGGGSSGYDGVDVGGGGIDIPMPDFSGIEPIKMDELFDSSGIDTFISGVVEKFKPFIEIMKSINFTPLASAFGNLWNSIKPILKTLGNNFAWVMNNILGPFAKWFMEEVAPTALDLIAAALDVISPILEVVSEVGQELWENFLQPIAEWTGELFIGAMETITDLLSTIGDWMSENKELIKDITIAVGLFFAAWKVIELMSFIQQSGGVIAALKNISAGLIQTTLNKIKDIAQTVILNALYAYDFIKASAKVIAQLVIQAAKWVITTAATIAHTVAVGAATAATWLFNTALAVLTSPITLVVAAIGALIAIVYALIKNWDTVKQVASNVWNWIVGVWEGAANWFSQNVTEPIFSIFTGAFESIGNFISETWDWICGLFTSGGQFFSDIGESIGEIFTGIVNALIDGLNWIIAQPFNFLNDILNSISGVDILGFKPFSWIGYNPLPVPEIPKLDVGTNYVARDGLAMIHQGEAVVPKKYNPALGGTNQEQIELLIEQNQLLRELLEKDNNIYLDGDKLDQNRDRIEQETNYRLGYSY